MRKHGQVSLFIILGLIILFGVLFVFFRMQEEQKGQSTKPLAQTVIAEAEKLQVQSYVQACLETATDEALGLLGRQGGKIYASQGGLDPDYAPSQKGVLFQEFEEVNVPLLLKRSPFHNPPSYPWNKFPYVKESATITRNFISNAFGKVDFMPLYAADGGFSVEEKLSRYIENRMPGCIGEFAVFADRYTFTQGPLAVNLTIALNDFVVKLKYPFTMQKGDKRVGFSEFVYKPGIRLRRMYNTTLDFLKQDSTNALFHMQLDSASVFGNTTNLNDASGRMIILADKAGADDLIQIVDLKSEFKTAQPGHYEQKYFTWTFYRQNRPPALHYVTDAPEAVAAGEAVYGANYPAAPTFTPVIITPPVISGGGGGLGGGGLGGGGFALDPDAIANALDVEQLPKTDTLDLASSSLTGTAFNNDATQEEIVLRVASVSSDEEKPVSLGLRYNLPPIISGNMVDFDASRQLLFVPTYRSNTYTTLLLYPGFSGTSIALRNRNAFSTRVLNGQIESILFAAHINATDPDEDVLSYDLSGVDFTTNIASVPISLLQVHCCRGGFLLEAHVTDGALSDKQAFSFIIDKHLDDDQICHRDASIGC